MDNVLKQIKDSGRSTDNIVGHLTAGEIVIPKIIIDNKDVKEYLINIFDFHDIDIDEFTVGNKKNKINPKTGYPEFFINKIVKTISNIFRGGGGGDKKKKSSGSNNNQQQADLQKQQADLQAKLVAERKAAEAERKRLAAEKAERERQQAIQAENQKAADFRRSAESKLQKNFQSMAENQQLLDQQSAQGAAQTVAGGSGYNMATAQQQKIAAAGGAGGVAGPAATNAPGAGQMGIPQTMASNVGTGGTQQSTNRFALPTASGLQFGGM